MTSAEKGEGGSRNTPNLRANSILRTKRGSKNPKIVWTSHIESPLRLNDSGGIGGTLSLSDIYAVVAMVHGVELVSCQGCGKASTYGKIRIVNAPKEASRPANCIVVCGRFPPPKGREPFFGFFGRCTHCTAAVTPTTTRRTCTPLVAVLDFAAKFKALSSLRRRQTSIF